MAIPAANPEDPFILEVLLQASLQSALITDKRFQQSVAEVTQVALLLSHECITRAGLTRHSEPDHADNHEIRWPSGEVASRLQAAVTFPKTEINTELARRNIGTDGLRLLTFQFGHISAEYTCPLENPTLRTPIAATESDLIVIAPTNILPATRDAIFDLAVRYGILPQLAQAIEVHAWQRIMGFFDLQRWELRGRRKPHSNDGCEVLFFQFDEDKLAAVYLVVDDLQSGSREASRRRWDLTGALDRVSATGKTVEHELLSKTTEVAELLHVVVIHGAGRPHIYSPPALSSDRTSSVCLSLDELRVYTQLSSGDSLGLWQFAKAKQSAHGRVKSMFGGFLDQFASFRTRHAFYHGDDGVPDLVMFMGPGGSVRIEAQRILDPHIVRLPDGPSYGRVVRLQNIPGFPIYTTGPEAEGPIRLLVEGLPLPIWVLSGHDVAAADFEKSRLCYHLADAVAFWIWQLSPTIQAWYDEASLVREAITMDITIMVGVDNPNALLSPPDTTNATGIAATSSEDHLSLCFDSVFLADASQPDNRAEQNLARLLLTELAALFGYSATQSELEAAMERHAPLGNKRRMKTLTDRAMMSMDTTGLPRPRTIQQFEQERICDEVGEIVSSLVPADRRLTAEESHTVHQKIVKTMFDRLEHEVAQFDDGELLPQLISRHEALIAERRRTESIVGSHLAVMGDTPEHRQKLQEDLLEIDKASTASRFLLEYVSARPPGGGRAFSTAAYDRLLAIAAEIIESGYISDVLHYGVSDMQLQMARSRRLKCGQSAYVDAVQQLQHRFFDAIAIASLSKNATAHQADDSELSTDQEKEDEALTIAANAEFGLPLEKIGMLVGAIVQSEFSGPNGTGSAKSAELTQLVSAVCSIEHNVVEHVLDQFTSIPRKRFLQPPSPCERADTYPWRFNRPLSYLRKPFLRRGEQLHWGRRALLQAVSYLCDLCGSGRIKNPRTQEMKTLIAKIADMRGKRYNQALATAIAGYRRYQTRAQISSFNGRRMERQNGQPIGDVDIAVLDPGTRTLFAVEAKSLTMAKTPAEVNCEVEALFIDTANKKCAVNRHLERVEWLRNHVEDVLAEFRCPTDDTASWNIEPLLVLDTDLLSRHLVAAPFRVFDTNEILAFLGDRV